MTLLDSNFGQKNILKFAAELVLKSITKNLIKIKNEIQRRTSGEIHQQTIPRGCHYYDGRPINQNVH